MGTKKYSSLYEGDLYMAEVLRNLCVNLGIDDFDMQSGMLTNVICSVEGTNSQGVARLIRLQYKEFDDVKKVVKALELKPQKDDHGVQVIVIVVELGGGLPPPSS
jgi:hypothetical protein